MFHSSFTLGELIDQLIEAKLSLRHHLKHPNHEQETVRLLQEKIVRLTTMIDKHSRKKL